MIYTITLNPALDYHMMLDNLNIGTTNRSQRELIKWGGKGINVSKVLTNLGIANTALGFVAGFTGDALEAGLISEGLKTDFIHLDDGMTRINVKLNGIAETEINANGPVIDATALNQLYAQLEQLTDNDYLVIAGSLPASMPADTYEVIMQKASKAAIIVDTTGDLLLNCLSYRPFLIKPNHKELGDLFDCAIELEVDDCIATVTKLARRLQEKGAVNVCVSLSYKGAVLVTESGDSYFAPGKAGSVVSSVGAGDSMVAGFLASYITDADYEKALKTGIAAASASCFSTELATQQNIIRYL